MKSACVVIRQATEEEEASVKSAGLGLVLVARPRKKNVRVFGPEWLDVQVEESW